MGDSVLSGVDPARLQSLRFFNLFRLIIAGNFLVAGRELNLGSEHPTIFIVNAIC